MSTARPVFHVCAGHPGADVSAVARELVEEGRAAGLSAQLVDLGPLLAADPGSFATDAEDVLSAAMDLAEAVDAELLVSSATVPQALRSLGFGLHARLASALGAGIVMVMDGDDATALRVVTAEAARNQARVIGVRRATGGWSELDPMPDAAPGRVRRVSGPEATEGMDEHLVRPNEGVAQVLSTLGTSTCLVVPDGREDVLLGLALGLGTGKFSAPGAVVLAGEPNHHVVDLLARFAPGLPIMAISSETSAPSTRDMVQRAAEVQSTRPLTPLLFKRGLVRDARAAGKHIVLPEGEEPRILRATAELLQLAAARITLLADPARVTELARELGIDVSGAEVVDPLTSPLRENFAAEYARLRAKKGVTLEQARERMTDVSYFGTMMVHLGIADGMVSGAIHTTAHTIKPSFEIIKTQPGVAVVSSVFFMCLADKVLVFGDCAVNPNPTAEQLADIAVSSSRTASQFGFDPRVALLSYSTGTSGTGPDVDLVLKATQLVREAAPQLRVDGPLQFDAAVDQTVAKSKAPGSEVAGRANVLVFPDLSAGNAAYKAVQRTAGAVAIGPVLQGLNKPVNDLSRGALVEDIVNTVLITAIQAGQQP